MAWHGMSWGWLGVRVYLFFLFLLKTHFAIPPYPVPFSPTSPLLSLHSTPLDGCEFSVLVSSDLPGSEPFQSLNNNIQHHPKTAPKMCFQRFYFVLSSDVHSSPQTPHNSSLFHLIHSLTHFVFARWGKKVFFFFLARRCSFMMWCDVGS